jgi:hypothetical protein
MACKLRTLNINYMKSNYKLMSRAAFGNPKTALRSNINPFPTGTTSTNKQTNKLSSMLISDLLEEDETNYCNEKQTYLKY